MDLPTRAGGEFTTTHWSVVLQTGSSQSAQAAAALERLCQTYWYPLYWYVRRRGRTPEDAQDLTQQFFAHFLEKGSFTVASPRRGRLRTFLLHCLQNFLANEWKRDQRVKRGGGAASFPLDTIGAEHRYAREPVSALTPEFAYEKRWAMTLLEQVLNELKREYEGEGNGMLFEQLSELLWGKDSTISYARISERLGISESGVRGAMYRLRARYRERLRAEVAQTVADVKEVEDELRYLMGVVGRKE